MLPGESGSVSGLRVILRRHGDLPSGSRTTWATPQAAFPLFQDPRGANQKKLFFTLRSGGRDSGPKTFVSPSPFTSENIQGTCLSPGSCWAGWRHRHDRRVVSILRRRRSRQPPASFVWGHGTLRQTNMHVDVGVYRCLSLGTVSIRGWMVTCLGGCPGHTGHHRRPPRLRARSTSHPPTCDNHTCLPISPNIPLGEGGGMVQQNHCRFLTGHTIWI